MDLDHINTIGLATTIIAAPVFTGIYTLGSMMYYHASNAMVNTFSLNEAAKLIPSVTNTITEATKETAKFIPSAANAVVLRATNALVVVKQAIEPICEPMCEAIKPQPLMIAPPPAPVVISTIVSTNFTSVLPTNSTAHTVSANINAENPSYGHMFRFLVDSYRIGGKIKNGEYLQAGAYGIGMAIDYAMNETLSTTAGTYAESLTGSSSAGLLVKAIFSITTSIALRKVVPFFAEGVYSYFVPTPVVAANQPIEEVAKIEKNKPEIQKTAAVTNIVENNVNTTVNMTANKPEVENKIPSKTQEKIKPAQKIRRETSDERQFKRKLAELGVVEQENVTAVPETIVTTGSSKKKSGQKQHRMTSNERQFERKLAELGVFDQENITEQDENKYVEPNYDEFLNKKNDYGFVQYCDKKVEKTALTDVTNGTVPTARTVSIPTPAQRREAKLARLAEKAAAEKANLVQVVAIDGQARELAKRSFKDNGCHPDLNITVANTGNVASLSSTLRVENEQYTPMLDGAKFVFDALANLLTITPANKDEISPAQPVVTPAKNLDWARKESEDFWNQATNRSYTRMKKAEKHLNETLQSKYSDEAMIERANSMFNDSKEMYEKDRDYLTSIPKAAVNF